MSHTIVTNSTPKESQELETISLSILDEPRGRAAESSTANAVNLVAQLDKEQDEVLLELDELNERIEVLIQTNAQSRREAAEDATDVSADAA